MNLVIWLQIQQGGGVEFFNPAVGVLARLYGKLNPVGFIAPQGVVLNGVKNIAKEDLKNLDYDLILVVGKNASLLPILTDAETLGINPDKVVLDRTVCIPLFTMEKYNKLRRSQLSIFSIDCWGGVLYNKMGLPFLSPTINMFISGKDFLKFLKDPINILKKQLIYQRNEFEKNMHVYYPVFKIGDVEWHMNHYSDINDALIKWYERSYKINWFNLLVVASTESPEFAEEFDKLPYTKKICFVPFKTNLDSCFYLDKSKYPPGSFWSFGDMARKTAKGEIIEYDMWELLLYGKKTPLNNVVNR